MWGCFSWPSSSDEQCHVGAEDNERHGGRLRDAPDIEQADGHHDPNRTPHVDLVAFDFEEAEEIEHPRRGRHHAGRDVAHDAEAGADARLWLGQRVECGCIHSAVEG